MRDNPRYKHYCKIVRRTGETSFSDGEESLVYEGVCRRESSDNIRTFNTGSTSIGQVNHTDYRVSIPGKVPTRDGDLITVFYDLGNDVEAKVLNPDFSPLGDATELYYNLPAI